MFKGGRHGGQTFFIENKEVAKCMKQYMIGC